MNLASTSRRSAWLLSLAVLVGACSSGAGAQDRSELTGAIATPTTAGTGAFAPVDDQRGEGEEAWPGSAWTEVSAAAAGLDQAALDDMAAAAARAGSQCLVVTKDGELVGEWYWGGFGPSTEREVFSVTKSITSTLVGIAQDRGLLDIDDRASNYIEAWQGTPSEDVTIRNLVSNDSGRFQDFDTDYVQMALGADDKTGFSIALDQQHEPGTQWVYNNAAIQTLEAILEEATGQPVHAFAEEALFEPIGMRSSISTDPAGNTLTFMGAQASCLDLARFGLLFLREGAWDGEQVVSAEWVAEATAPSQELNEGYGYLWWLDREGGTYLDGGDGDGRSVGPSSSGTYAALGLHNQLLGVYPDDGVVATRLGADRGEGGESFGLAALSAGVTAALDRAPAGENVTNRDPTRR